MSDVTIRTITPDQHDVVMHYFDMVAYADNPNWSRCYCCERIVEDYEDRTKEQNRALRSDRAPRRPRGNAIRGSAPWCASSSRRTSGGRASPRCCSTPPSSICGRAG